MDIFSHGLWAAAVYKAINNKKQKRFSLWRAAFWGLFPDLFAFGIGFVWLFWNVAFGNLDYSAIPGPHSVEPAPRNALPIFALTSALYNISHSAVIFTAAFAAAFLIFRRPVWEMGGWLLHILMDIPTHSYKFYPTPFFWPLSDLKFDGFSWGTPWFLALNYATLIVVFFLLRKNKNSLS